LRAKFDFCRRLNFWLKKAKLKFIRALGLFKSGRIYRANFTYQISLARIFAGLFATFGIYFSSKFALKRIKFVADTLCSP